MNINFKEYLPFDCISPNLLIEERKVDYIEDGDNFYMGGTGFFCQFPDYDDIFYVTVRHCLINPHENKITLKKIKIAYQAIKEE